MKSALAILLLATPSLQGQVTVQTGKQVLISRTAATAIVSLDSHVADASVNDGVVTIAGIGPGHTRVIAISENGLEEIPVLVFPGPPVFPPGFLPPYITSSNGGNYSFRFSSDRMEFENALDIFSKVGRQSRQMHFVSATFADGGSPSSYVPSAYYRISTPDVDVTFLDQTVDNSPLTLQNVILRGFHLRDHGWEFHGGYTASAEFAGVFLPAEQEIAVGLSHTSQVSNFLSLTPNIYFMRSINPVNGQKRSAPIGSLLFDLHFPDRWNLRTEIAYGRVPAFALELLHSSVTTQLKARLTQKNIEFPSVRLNSFPGLSGEASWSQVLTPRLGVLSGTSINNVDLGVIKQNAESAFANLRYRISNAWSAGTGINYGLFKSAGYYSARTVVLPQQVNFDRAHLGLGFQWQWSRASDSFANGFGFRPTLRLNLGRFQIGAFVDWQSDALSVDSMYSLIPGLQRELQRLGIIAVTPDQLAGLLQNTAFLQSLGISTHAQIVTVPHRLQRGGNLTWNSSGIRPHQLNFTFIESHNKFTTSTSDDFSFTASYSKEITANNLFQLSASTVQFGSLGQPQRTQVVSVSLQHTFSRVPTLFTAHQTVNINGTVFIDTNRKGLYENGMETVPRATIVLDGEKTTTTDSRGQFCFCGVSTANHRVELQYKSDRGHYFTTPQETITSGNATINFGIAFATVDHWGYVEDDAGNGLENVVLHLIGSSGNSIPMSTDRTGKFRMPDVKTGHYEIRVDPSTVAIGYSTENMSLVPVDISGTSESHPRIKIPAVRVLRGIVTAYDPMAGKYKPFTGAIVSIPEFLKSATTNSSGKFVITGLPPGDMEVKVVAGRSSHTHMINVPTQPATLVDDFRVSSLNGQIASTLTRLRH